MNRPQHALLDLPERVDTRGGLAFAQEGDHIPFPVKQFFAIYGVAEGASRGAHAHRTQHQFIVMMHGKAVVTVDDGAARTLITLDRPNQALYTPPMLWLELDQFSAGAVCLVLTSDAYSEKDYIRDRSEFLRLAGAGG